MSGIETRFTASDDAAGDDAERIRRAFYGFVSAHEADAEDGACLRTEIGASGQELFIRLWSAEAMDAFLSGLPGLSGRPNRRLCYE